LAHASEGLQIGGTGFLQCIGAQAASKPGAAKVILNIH
jgi:hypothetical protein